MRKLFNVLLLVLIAFTFASCHKELDVKDPIVSNDEMTVSGAQARFSWCVEFTGAFQTGVELSPNENMTELRRVEAKKEGDKYVAVVDGLLMGTKYYYRIVVWNKLNNYVQEMKSFSTSTAYTVTFSCNPEAGGMVMGGGSYVVGDSCTVTATANVGYNFVNWTENESQISAEAEYSFAVTVNRNLVANFTSQEYTITATAEPEEGGTVDGSGGYNNGDECTLTATANEGYEFLNWTKEDGTIVSTDPVYAFTVAETAAFVAHFQLQSYTITVSADQEEGGFVEGGGTYEYGQNCTVRATEANGYHFVNWTENGEQVSSEEEYTFTVTGNRDLVANFTSQQYTITVSASPTDGGSVTGGGTYYEGEQCTVTATANTGYAFTEWCEIIGDSTGGIEVSVSSDADYTFTVNSDRTLVAKFIALPQTPVGAIDGKFTIDGNGNKVYFSQGNLQYIGSSGTWKFADHQWEVIGTSQGNTSKTTTRDLFGWGTSGYNHGAVCYQPWSTSQTNSDYYAYGDYQYNLYDQTGQADWGYNSISNGGGQEGQWRTLTKEEWVWALGPNSNANPGTNCRTSSTVNGMPNARYAKAKVNNLQGVILFPDSYTHPSSVAQPVGINETGNTGWNGNNYSTTDFGLMQDNGAVFLPAAGDRNGASVGNVGSFGYYWSASYFDSDYACRVYFNDSYLGPQVISLRYYGFSVRLVRVAQ